MKIGPDESTAHPGWNNWIGFVSVREGYFGKGIGRLLVENLFKYASENDIHVLTSGYSMRGWIHLRKHIHNYAFKYNVRLNDPETKPSFYDFIKYEGFGETEYKKLVDKFTRPAGMTKHYCCCCARQITHHNTSNDYECPLPSTYMGPALGYCCAECSQDLDSEGLFPEERGKY